MDDQPLTEQGVDTIAALVGLTIPGDERRAVVTRLADYLEIIARFEGLTDDDEPSTIFDARWS